MAHRFARVFGSNLARCSVPTNAVRSAAGRTRRRPARVAFPTAAFEGERPLYTRCIVCSAEFEPNEELEHLPHGKRVAFDPGRGRLWVVCRTCRRWSLTPIEDRWEALEELEKLTVDRAHLLSRTDNISLLRSGDMEVVRVGQAQLSEEAWWRYGRELASRRRNWQKLGVAGTMAAGAVVVGSWATGGMTLFAAWLIMGHGSETVRDVARWLRFGSTAWQGEQRCAVCGAPMRRIPYSERAAIGLFRDEGSGGLELVARCHHCGTYRDGGVRLGGEEADRTLRRVLAYHHFAGASERRVMSAARLIQEAGSPSDLARIVIKDGRRLGDLQRTGGIALEIATNEANEQHLLELELAELEAHWKREEELAGIIDGELSGVQPGMIESLRRRVTGSA